MNKWWLWRSFPSLFLVGLYLYRSHKNSWLVGQTCWTSCCWKIIGIFRGDTLEWLIKNEVNNRWSWCWSMNQNMIHRVTGKLLKSLLNNHESRQELSWLSRLDRLCWLSFVRRDASLKLDEAWVFNFFNGTTYVALRSLYNEFCWNELQKQSETQTISSESSFAMESL